MFVPPLFGTLRKKIVCTEKVFGIDHAQASLWISLISFIISLDIAGQILFMYFLEEKQLCSRKSKFPSYVHLVILPILKFQSGWW